LRRQKPGSEIAGPAPCHGSGNDANFVTGVESSVDGGYSIN